MKLPITINGEVLYAEIPDEEINKLIAKKKKKTGYEKADYNKVYYTIAQDDKVHSDVDTCLRLDRIRFDNMNYFSDKTLAENMARAQKLWKSINHRSVELCEPVDVATGGKAWTILFLYVSGTKEIKPIDLMYYRYFGNIWFDTKEHCQQVIDEFHDDLLWYFTEFKNRADM